MIKNITRNIGFIGPLSVKVVCFINEIKTQENSAFNKKKAFSKWITGSVNNKEVSITYNYATFLILDYNSSKNEYYDKKKFIMMPIFQISGLLSFLKESLKLFDLDGTFYYETIRGIKTLKLYDNKYLSSSRKFIRDCMLFGKLVIVQSETENISYEGIRIMNTHSENYFELTIDQLEELIYFLAHTDFITLSQTLVNSNILWLSNKLTEEMGMVSNSSESLYESERHAEELQIRKINNIKVPKQNIFDGLATSEIVNK